MPNNNITISLTVGQILTLWDVIARRADDMAYSVRRAAEMKAQTGEEVPSYYQSDVDAVRKILALHERIFGEPMTGAAADALRLFDGVDGSVEPEPDEF